MKHVCYQPKLDTEFFKSAENKLYGVTSDRTKTTQSILLLKAINYSSKPQSLALKQIGQEFTIDQKDWYIPGKSEISIPVEFHPTREQTQYVRTASFEHKFGTIDINLSGTGASADLIADEYVDFGNLKLGATGQQNLVIL